MADRARVSNDDVRSLTRLADLNPPDNRLDQLVSTLSAYLDSLGRLRQIDAVDNEPPTITFESEAAR